jgi:hypothetical protein
VIAIIFALFTVTSPVKVFADSAVAVLTDSAVAVLTGSASRHLSYSSRAFSVLHDDLSDPCDSLQPIQFVLVRFRGQYIPGSVGIMAG